MQAKKRPMNNTGWLKTSLTIGSIALTVLGAGAVALRDAAEMQVAEPAANDVAVAMNWEPIPTVIPLENALASLNTPTPVPPTATPAALAQQEIADIEMATSTPIPTATATPEPTATPTVQLQEPTATPAPLIMQPPARSRSSR